MGAAASQFSISRGSVFIKSCRSPARTGVSHSKISWQLSNLKAQEFDIRPKKKKSIVSNFSALHLAYSLGRRKVKSQKEEKNRCIRHWLCAGAAQPPEAGISPSLGKAQSRSGCPVTEPHHQLSPRCHGWTQSSTHLPQDSSITHPSWPHPTHRLASCLLPGDLHRARHRADPALPVRHFPLARHQPLLMLPTS